MSEYKSNQSRSQDSSSRRDTSQLTELMTQRLQDQSIVARYGTSLRFSMGKDYTEYLNQKYATLREEFKKIDKNSDEEITFDELLGFLQDYQKETGIEITKDYVEDLFDFMDYDHGKSISV